MEGRLRLGQKLGEAIAPATSFDRTARYSAA